MLVEGVELIHFKKKLIIASVMLKTHNTGSNQNPALIAKLSTKTPQQNVTVRISQGTRAQGNGITNCIKHKQYPRDNTGNNHVIIPVVDGGVCNTMVRGEEVVGRGYIRRCETR